MAITNITSTEQFNTITAGTGDKQTIVDFWAAWCGPCRALTPTLEKMEQEGLIDLIKVDVDANPELSTEFQIMSIPTMLFYKNGEQNLSSLMGAMPRQAIEKHLAS